MNWVDRELRKREKQAAREARQAQKAQAKAQPDEATASPVPAADGAAIQALWARFEAVNQSLPDPLRLKREVAGGEGMPFDRWMFRVLLSAKNGATIGYTGDAIRYIWPRKNPRSSNNFWIRWQPGLGLRASRRTRPSLLRGATEERAFKASSVEHIFRCLVTDQRVKFSTVCKRRFWLF